jgi:hypothetical protein
MEDSIHQSKPQLSTPAIWYIFTTPKFVIDLIVGLSTREPINALREPLQSRFSTMYINTIRDMSSQTMLVESILKCASKYRHTKVPLVFVSTAMAKREHGVDVQYPQFLGV